jgi:hypothetical protein
VAHELEARAGTQRVDVVAGAGEEVVDAQDVVPLTDQPLAQMGPEEAGPPGHEHTPPQSIPAHV